MIGYNYHGCERFRNDSQGWERNWNENFSNRNGNGTGTERVPVADFGTRTELSSIFVERNGTERSSENFGTGTELVPNSKIRNGTGTERPFSKDF